MKPNTPNNLSVPCDQVGRLILVGVMGQTATFWAVALRILDPDMFKRHMDAKFKSVIVTEPVNNVRKVTSVIFQRDFTGELRNPKGLLKVVRSKMQRVISSAEAEALRQDELVDLSEKWENPFEDELDEDNEGEEDNAAEYRAQQEFAQQLPSFIARGDTRFFA